MRRVRAGDSAPAAERVRPCEPTVRRFVPVRLINSGLRRLLDSMDICQSVMGSFFVRVAAGQFDLDTPEQLAGLLATMAHHKLADQNDKHRKTKKRLPPGRAEPVDE